MVGVQSQETEVSVDRRGVRRLGGLQAAGGQWGATEDTRTSHEQGAKTSGPGS